MSRPSREFMIDKLMEDMESWPDEDVRNFAFEERRENLKYYYTDEDLMEYCDSYLPEGWEKEFWK